MTSTQSNLYHGIVEVIKDLNPDAITSERKVFLDPLIEFIQTKTLNQQEIRINFICTHNSRRSHLSQVWAQTLASYFNVKNVFCYSGGTEETALFPMVAQTLISSGFMQSIWMPAVLLTCFQNMGTERLFEMGSSAVQYTLIG